MQEAHPRRGGCRLTTGHAASLGEALGEKENKLNAKRPKKYFLFQLNSIKTKKPQKAPILLRAPPTQQSPAGISLPDLAICAVKHFVKT